MDRSFRCFAHLGRFVRLDQLSVYRLSRILIIPLKLKSKGIGVSQAYYETHQLKEYSPSAKVRSSSIQVFNMLVMVCACAFGSVQAAYTKKGPIVGKFHDHDGPRALSMVGTVLHVHGLCLASLAKEYHAIFLSQAICSPIGASCLFYACACLIL